MNISKAILTLSILFASLNAIRGCISKHDWMKTNRHRMEDGFSFDLFDDKHPDYNVTYKERYISGGSFGEVFKVFMKTPNPRIQKKAVLKVIKIDPTMVSDMVNEIENEVKYLEYLQSFDNLHFLNYEGCIADTDALGRFKNRVFLITEQLDYSLDKPGDKKKLYYSFSDRLGLIVMMTRGLALLEERNIVHLDVKPANIMIKIMNGIPIAKIIDYGFLLKSGEYVEKGTPNYTDLHRFEDGYRATSQSDLYSLALTIDQIFYPEMNQSLDQSCLSSGSRLKNCISTRLVNIRNNHRDWEKELRRRKFSYLDHMKKIHIYIEEILGMDFEARKDEYGKPKTSLGQPINGFLVKINTELKNIDPDSLYLIENEHELFDRAFGVNGVVLEDLVVLNTIPQVHSTAARSHSMNPTANRGNIVFKQEVFNRNVQPQANGYGNQNIANYNYSGSDEPRLPLIYENGKVVQMNTQIAKYAADQSPVQLENQNNYHKPSQLDNQRGQTNNAILVQNKRRTVSGFMADDIPNMKAANREGGDHGQGNKKLDLAGAYQNLKRQMDGGIYNKNAELQLEQATPMKNTVSNGIKVQLDSIRRPDIREKIEVRSKVETKQQVDKNLIQRTIFHLIL